MKKSNKIMKIMHNGKIISGKFISQDSRGIWIRRFNFHDSELCIQPSQIIESSMKF